MVLDVTRAARFTPGTNLRGEATGASWVFALPSLEIGTAVCLGAPPAGTLRGLAQRARSVVVVEPGARWRRRTQPWATGRDDVTLVASPAEVPDGVADLVVLAPAAARRLPRDAAATATLQRLLAADGVVFADCGVGPGPAGLAETLTRLLGAGRRTWLTPSRGEVRSAVPAADEAAVAFVLAHRMGARSVDLTEVKRATVRRRRDRDRRRARTGAAAPLAAAAAPPAAARAPAPRPAPAPAGAHRRLGRLRGPGTRALDGAQRAVDRLESVVVGTGPLGRLGRRHAVVAGPAGRLGAGPPQYVADVAAASGVDVTGLRWALSAPGEYSSRKVLVLLFGPQPGDGLSVVVKLTRDPALNPRLENEGAALRLCADAGVEGAPQHAFSGRHAGLALLGQHALAGRPFEAVASGRADDPHVRDAVDWVTDLGVRTADRGLPPTAVADAAADVLARFTDVYDSDAAERARLAALVDRLAGCQVPAVLAHGDPGTWNAMVTPEGRTAFLDWEAAEPSGLPLFDLFYLVRTVGLVAPGADVTRDHARGFARAFLADTPLRSLLVTATRRYAATVGVPHEAVEPLWALTWMHRALKEATRLPAGRLDQGHFVNVLRESLARPDDLLALLREP